MNVEPSKVKKELLQRQLLVNESEVNHFSDILKKIFLNPLDYFLLQIGDCAERFEDSSKDAIYQKCHFYVEAAKLLETIIKKKVVIVGRIAGQYAKPRSLESETKNGMTFPIYRGDMINGFEFSEKSRTHDLKRVLKAYENAKNALKSINDFNLEFGQKIFTSHEALVLDYEEGLTRQSQVSDKFFDSSAHTVWLGYRSNECNGPQVDYLSRISNSIGIKVGPTKSPENLDILLKKLNPKKIKGKIYLITRFGLDSIESMLPKFIEVVKKSKVPVLWSVDPMHGNTFQMDGNRKVRAVSDIMKECLLTIQIHQKYNTDLQGLHLEASCDSVTECVFEYQDARDHNFTHYTTQCDPRLNPDQVRQVLKFFGQVFSSHSSKDIVKHTRVDNKRKVSLYNVISS